ncbi:MAG TPA: GNAT family N-acetyltransferase [Gemmatimonadales bacterium]|nr:GNAT family N-acetyltransferase [Gemmatimonadales bacterium]
MSRLARYVRECQTFPLDARIAWSNEGWRGVWEAIATRTLRKVVRNDRMILFAQGLDDLPDAPSLDGVTVTRLLPRELPMLAYLVSRRDLEAFRGLLAAGRIAVVAWRDGRAVGYAWMAERLAADVTRCPIPLPEEAVYLWNLYVLPAERGRGVGSALAGERLAIARELGYREGWRMIAPRNLASLRTLRAGGATRIVGEVRVVRLLGRLRASFLPPRMRV